MLEAEGPTAEWVAGMCTTIRATYFVEDMSRVERHAWVKGYWEALANLPAPFVEEAQRRCFSRLERKPSPADIANLARQLIRDAQNRLRLERTPEPRDEPDIPPPSPEAIAEIDALVAQLAGKPDTSDVHVPTWPVPMSDRELAALLKANPRVDPNAPLDRIRAAEGISRPEDVRAARRAVERRAAQRADLARESRARAPEYSHQPESRE